jgi:hypothetical protein
MKSLLNHYEKKIGELQGRINNSKAENEDERMEFKALKHDHMLKGLDIAVI